MISEVRITWLIYKSWNEIHKFNLLSSFSVFCDLGSCHELKDEYFNDESNRLISWTCSKLIKTMLQLILLRTFCKCSTFKATAVVRVKFLGTLTHCYTPWKRQKTFGFLTFSGGIEMWHWTKMGENKPICLRGILGN